MRTISSKKITDVVADLAQEANIHLRKDVLLALRKACLLAGNARAKRILKAVIDNANYARQEKLAICQDTGMPVVFLELGQGVRIAGNLYKAVNRGIQNGYQKAFLRKSIVSGPLLRGAPKFTPGIIHTDIVGGDRLKITVLPKGFGCENKSRLKMFKPTDGIDQIKKFIIDCVSSAGPDACPPYVVGAGIGGTADYACILAKKALLRKISSDGTKLERDLLTEINKSGIGPMGLGGGATALAVNIETYPTHIAGLPVAVNISCHALRSASKIL